MPVNEILIDYEMSKTYIISLRNEINIQSSSNNLIMGKHMTFKVMITFEF